MKLYVDVDKCNVLYGSLIMAVTHDFGHFGDVSIVMHLGSQQGLFA
jgi:hypothetical protein